MKSITPRSYCTIGNDCDIAIIKNNRVLRIRPPTRHLTGLKHVDVKGPTDIKSLPVTQGNYWIATNECIEHSFHPGTTHPFPKKLRNGLQVVYNGIASDIQSRIKQHLCRQTSKGMSGISLDLLLEADATLSHTKLAFHPTRGGIHSADGKLQHSSQLCSLPFSAKEKRWLHRNKDSAVYFKNGIDVADYKHRKHQWRVYYVECPNKFVNDIVEKQWRRANGLPRLCTYSEAR
jgi:hypothetical protein